ncbi:fructoselysine 6-phosphate deglycase [Dethiothermospora halolimnae]|uniref:fructoselysine 6-phosphate deglycase n=1 Tax=Dethiothermospora halolimnae TaxID=3114390 RepID=UPI003CCBC530
MLDIDKSTVDFLVTENMVDEVKALMEDGFPQLDKVIDKMIERKIERVYFVACGSPLCACKTAKMLFDKYSDIPSEAYSGFDFLDHTPYKLDSKTMVIGVSDSGKTEEVVKAVAHGRKEGALTLGVTCKPSGSGLTEAAEYVIGYGGETIWHMHLLVNYYIAARYINSQKEHPELVKILEDMSKLPSILEDLVVSSEEKSKELGIKASKWEFIYTVGAGPLLPLAYKEGIITMLEFTRTHGSMLNAAEFRHGPLEVVEEGVSYVFILGNDESRHTVERNIKFVRKFTDNVIVFDIKDYNDQLHPMLTPMVLFVPLEYFYYYLSISKDHNPDDRRYYGGLVEY